MAFMTSRPHRVRLGETDGNSVAAALYALLDRGVARMPELAARTKGAVVLRFDEGYAPVRVAFTPAEVVVEDGEDAADATIEGRLPDVIAMTRAPLLAGVPNPANRAGRAALARLARGHVRVRGRRDLSRALLRLLALDA